MRHKLPCILVSILLGGAAAPPTECTQTGVPGQTYPMAIDLTGQSGGSTGLSGQTFAALPGPEGNVACRSPLPGSATQTSTLRSESADVIHGLPAPDILRPITDPQPRPEFR